MSSKLSHFFTGLSKEITKRGPELLVAFGVSGFLATTVSAVSATPKAMKRIEQAKEEKGDDLTPIETVKAAWLCYLPAGITFVVSTGCVLGANSIHARRHAALATAYKLSETAFSEYREKVVESLGERKDNAIRDLVAKKHVEENPVSTSEVIITEKGNTLCYDHISGRYFKSDIDKINKAVNELNKEMIHGMGGFVSLNDFYDELGLSHTKMGDDLGWNLDKGLIEIHFGSHIADDGTPCIVLDYLVAPVYDYDRR